MRRMNGIAVGQALVWQGGLRGGTAAVLCALMVGQPLVAAASIVKRGPSAGVQPMRGEERVVHALNRLTFGPRPGDVAAVQAVGLSTWFEDQLNPGKIDDSALQARLAQFPAMQLSQAELMARYPSQQVIRQMEQRNLPLPSDPVERAIYGDQIAFYRIQKAKQAEAKTAAAAGDANSMGGDSMAGAGAPVVRKPMNAVADPTRRDDAAMNVAPAAWMGRIQRLIRLRRIRLRLSRLRRC